MVRISQTFGKSKPAAQAAADAEVARLFRLYVEAGWGVEDSRRCAARDVKLGRWGSVPGIKPRTPTEPSLPFGEAGDLPPEW